MGVPAKRQAPSGSLLQVLGARASRLRAFHGDPSRRTETPLRPVYCARDAKGLVLLFAPGKQKTGAKRRPSQPARAPLEIDECGNKCV